jgi:hypothetical protein
MRSGTPVAVGVCFLAAAAQAASPVQKECAAAYQNAQIAMKRGKLSVARESLQKCLADRCSAVLHEPCQKWLVEVDDRQPSVVVTFVDASGTPKPEVALAIDEQSIVAGKAVFVDPGVHVFTATPPQGEPVRVERVVIEGVKLAAVEISAAKVVKLSEPQLALSSPNTVNDLTASPPRGVPTLTWVAGGVSVAGLAAFGGLALWGKSSEGALEACRGACSAQQVGDVRSKYLAADIALGIAIAAAVTGTVALLLGSDDASQTPSTESSP